MLVAAIHPIIGHAIVILALVLLIAVCLREIIGGLKGGGCAGCNGGCGGGCAGCSSCHSCQDHNRPGKEA